MNISGAYFFSKSFRGDVAVAKQSEARSTTVACKNGGGDNF